jgi:hypothetical protein
MALLETQVLCGKAVLPYGPLDPYEGLRGLTFAHGVRLALELLDLRDELRMHRPFIGIKAAPSGRVLH